MQHRISDYPLVIEPTVEILEITASDTPGSLKWTRLYRIATPVVLQELPGLTNNLVHFFGPSADLSTAEFLLGYACGGLLRTMLWRDEQRNWLSMDIPAEALGDAVTHPSVRCVFKTQRARESFLYYLEQIRVGRIVNPALAVVLDQLVGQPISVDVWSTVK